ncbi:MAG: flagellar brake domain-containing protein [Bacillota bacterium]|nr:flagellar brake domain-containing protein [Bacillota bacterium]
MIQIGDIITLELKNSKQLEKYKCRLVDRKANEFYIDYPLSLDTNRTVFLLDGTQLKATFVGNDGTSVYVFDGEIKGRIKNNIPMLILSYPGDDKLVKIQRRQFVRIETAIDIALHPFDNEFVPFTAITDDVSAGGVSFLVTKEIGFIQGMNVQIWLVLVVQNGEYNYMKLKGKIARIIEFNETRNKVSLQFIESSPQERQLLLRFCFDRQLENRKKGI